MACSMVATRAFITVLLCSGLAGCLGVTADSPDTPATTLIIQHAQDVLAAKEAKDGNVSLSAPFYAESGYDLAYTNCGKYFNALIKASNNVREAHDDLVAAGGAAATIMALAETSTKAIGMTAAGVGLGTLILDNYQRNTLITPYPIQTYRLVKDAMITYRTSLPPSGATNLLDAQHRVSGYASLCTYASIAVLADQAIANSTTTDKSKTGTSIFTANEIAVVLPAVKAILGPTAASLKDDHYALLEILSEPDISDSIRTKVLAGLPVELKPVVYDEANKQTTEVLKKAGSVLQTLAQTNPTFKARIDEIRAANASDATGTRGVSGLVLPSSESREPRIEVIPR